MDRSNKHWPLGLQVLEPSCHLTGDHGQTTLPAQYVYGIRLMQFWTASSKLTDTIARELTDTIARGFSILQHSQ